MKTFREQTYYELLDIPSNADHAIIVEAYKKARSTYNPNSPALYTVFTREEAEELVKLIDEAYNVLSNQFKRQQYDKKTNAVEATPDGKEKVVVTTEVKKEQSQQNINPEFEEQIKNQTQFSGSFLQQVRLYKGISIEQISETTKVSRTYLNALEAQDYSRLPATVFLRGFVTQYAKALGLDPIKVSQSYISIMGAQKK